MNRVTEIAEREAEEAEREEPTEEEAEKEAEQERESEQGQEPAPEPETERLVNAMQTALDKEDDRHEKAVAKILGEGMAAMTPCPLCLAHGFVPAEPSGDFDPMQREVVLWAMGEPKAAALEAHPSLYMCPTCDGLGELLTGSRKPETRTEGCPDCTGKGFRDKRYEDVAAASYPQAAPPLPAVTYPPPGMPANGNGGTVISQGGHTFTLAAGGAPDPVGRLAGHPLWGAPAESGGL